mgnify:FL=1
MEKIKDSEGKIFRILKIIKRLHQKEILNGENLANEFNVDIKTIQRDIKTLKDYLFEESDSDIKYSRAKNGYYLKSNDNKSLTNEEILAISKIILESRAFNKGETDNLIDKLINLMSGNDRNIIKDLISNEKFNYIPLQHGKDLLSVIWNLAQSVKNQEWLCLNYTTKSNEGRKYNVKPLSIMFSEYYFYLIAYIEAKEEYPAIFRIDRITEIKDINKKFKINYSEKFKDGEFRKYIHFMHSGPLTRIEFKYRGYIEYVLDKFPTAEILDKKIVKENNRETTVYTVKIEVYGSFGAEMWLRSQGDYVIEYKILK